MNQISAMLALYDNDGYARVVPCLTVNAARELSLWLLKDPLRRVSHAVGFRNVRGIRGIVGETRTAPRIGNGDYSSVKYGCTYVERIVHNARCALVEEGYTVDDDAPVYIICAYGFGIKELSLSALEWDYEK
jgi:hypothetical protein